jgi:hypothetical protein
VAAAETGVTDWRDLTEELDQWRAAGRIATVWWRDDDATAPSPALDRLLALQQKHAAPLMIAVIPARAEPDLAQRLTDLDGISIVQHGWAHANHAPVGASKAELGADRPAALVLGELARGQIVLDGLFGDWLRFLVPPHNRIAPALARELPRAGYVGLSTYNPRRGAITALTQINTHIDIMNWVTRAFGGEAAALALAVRHLRARRTGATDADEPTGLLTHHLAHDEAAWAFTDRFLTAIADHPAARLVDIRDLSRP